MQQCLGVFFKLVAAIFYFNFMTFPVEGQKQEAVPAKLEWVTPKFMPLLGENTESKPQNPSELRTFISTVGPS